MKCTGVADHASPTGQDSRRNPVISVVRLNKEGDQMRWTIVCVALVMNVYASAGDMLHSNPRSTIEAYLAAALAGKTAEAASLATRNREVSSASSLEDFRRMFPMKQIMVPTVWLGEKNGIAIAVTEPVTIGEANPDEQNRGRLLFDLVKSSDQWLVDGVDFEDEEGVTDHVGDFRKYNIDAILLPLKPQK